MTLSLTGPPVTITVGGLFHTGTDADVSDASLRRAYRQAVRRIAFGALMSGKPAAELHHVSGVVPPGEGVAGDRRITGSWLIADPAGNVTAHRGLHVGSGGPWSLANAIIPGSEHAVQRPLLNGSSRDRPDEFRDLVARFEVSRQRLRECHDEAIAAGHLYATMTLHPDPYFTALLRAAVGDRAAQLVLHDWLAERGFPHAHELRSKKRNKGTLTEGQLLDLLSKRFDSTRRSFSGRTV